MKRVNKRKIRNFFILGNQYKAELRSQIKSLILFTMGFTIAFTWREYSFESTKKLIKWLTGTQGSGALGAAFFITFICLFLMLLTSYYFKEKHRKTVQIFKKKNVF